MSHYTLERPTVAERPLLVEVPHAGTELPTDLHPAVEVSRASIFQDADLFVDRLYAAAPSQGATLLTTRTSRYVVDLNRSAGDVDALTVGDHANPRAHQPRGVVWRMSTDGTNVLPRPLTVEELDERLRRFHSPYHQAIESELRRQKEMFGYAVLLAAHSMPSVGRSGHTDSGVRRADVVPGTQGRSTASSAIIDLVEAHFRAAGLSVRHDDPYRGGFTTAHYGRPNQGIHAIQVELNRALYVDERTFEPRPGDFERLQTVLTSLVAKLATLSFPA